MSVYFEFKLFNNASAAATAATADRAGPAEGERTVRAERRAREAEGVREHVEVPSKSMCADRVAIPGGVRAQEAGAQAGHLREDK